MTLKVREVPYSLPSYSLTGDLMGFLRCGLQYRFRKIGRLVPSLPVQLWFGEFIHGVMDEAFRVYEQSCRASAPNLPPWPDATVNATLNLIERRLAARGLRAGSGDDRRLGFLRAKVAVQKLGPHLFPLVSRSEVRLYGTRMLGKVKAAKGLPERYEMTGVVDVLSSVEMRKPEHRDNAIVSIIKAKLEGDLPSSFEVIVDYKGSKRPLAGDASAKGQFRQNEWQIQTYAELRERQADAQPVAAGVLLYLNELMPNLGDLRQTPESVVDAPKDGVTREFEAAAAAAEDELGRLSEAGFHKRLKRTVHVVEVTGKSIQRATDEFDRVVEKIEANRREELRTGSVLQSWEANTADEKTCQVCDQRSFCPALQEGGRRRRIPTLPSVGARRAAEDEPIVPESTDPAFDSAAPAPVANDSSYALELVERILLWAHENPRFETDFVEDIRQKIYDGWRLTDAQVGALERIIRQWRVD